MRKARVERRLAENVKVHIRRADFLSASDACLEQLGIHERAGCRLLAAGAKAAMQIANVRDFDVDAVHESPLISIIASWYSLSLPAFLIFLKIFLGILGSRYSQKFCMCERIWQSPWYVLQAWSKMT